MPNGHFFLSRCLESIEKQTFTNYEVIVTNDGKMAENTNSAIKKATGELVKILYMDDYLTDENSLQRIADTFKGDWLVTGCKHDPGTHVHHPTWNDKIQEGVNTIGSPSVLTMKRESILLFDENLGWLLDCDLYKRLYDKYGLPTILNEANVTIGIHEGQSTHLMGEEIKIKEHDLMLERYKDAH